MLNHYKRYQKGLTIIDVFPSDTDGKCACGCGTKLPKGKKRWSSKMCRDTAVTKFFIIKGDNFIIRKELFKLERGICQKCGVYSDNWEADHILPVFKGGGGTELDNFQTLCICCHFYKTSIYNAFHQRAYSSHATEICCILFLNEFGAFSSIPSKTLA